MRLAEIFYANKNRPKAVFSLCFLISRNLGPGFAGFRKKDRDPLLVGRRFAFLLSGLCQYSRRIVLQLLAHGLQYFLLLSA